jgi:SAM-dependent methyltransferase
MLRRGYHAEGIEWSDAVVSAVHAFHPDLPIRQGDATRLDLPSNTYDAYVSLGVMEHRRDGPEPFLGEARRVLRPGGVAFISVPYCHALRRARIRLGLYHRRPPTDLDFYQYAFGREEFAAYLVSAGFAVLAQVSYGVVTGLREEIRL